MHIITEKVYVEDKQEQTSGRSTIDGKTSAMGKAAVPWKG